ncbi:ComEA family DNA-binding protein [Marinicellulosiphila megalodicopiae]|uniref:ComEA family DNA-binding protein n=1 Tax=Marinicellulosiphila megalodicopiae TaxID=2724896 RepID=UPI003BB0B76C
MRNFKFSTLVLSSLTAFSLLTGHANAEPMDTEKTSSSQMLLYVNINTDSQDTLSDLLVGVGSAKAQAIIEYREENGPFNSADELLNVKGIGEKILERNRDAIILKDIKGTMELSVK